MIVGITGCLSASSNSYAATKFDATVGEGEVFGSSRTHLRIGHHDSKGALTLSTKDQAGESDLAQLLMVLSRIPGSLEGGLRVDMVINEPSLSNAASDAVLDGEHEKAFHAYSVLVALSQKNNTARFHLSQYLMNGISGFLEPDENDIFRACQLLIEATWLEMRDHQDEPEQAGRLLTQYANDVYWKLSQMEKETDKLEEKKKEVLQAALFEKIKMMSKSPF